MNILGVGGPEFLIIVILMMIIAGPKRVVQWMYIAGTYVAKFRRMWTETVDVLQNEFDEAGVGIKLPKEVPTRANIKSQAAAMMSSVTAPMQDTLRQVDKEMKQISTGTDEAAKVANSMARVTNGHTSRTSMNVMSSKPVTKTNGSKRSATPKDNGFGTWSGGSKSDFGSWSRSGPQRDDEE